MTEGSIDITPKARMVFDKEEVMLGSIAYQERVEIPENFNFVCYEHITFEEMEVGEGSLVKIL